MICSAPVLMHKVIARYEAVADAVPEAGRYHFSARLQSEMK